MSLQEGSAPIFQLRTRAQYKNRGGGDDGNSSAGVAAAEGALIPDVPVCLASQANAIVETGALLRAIREEPVFVRAAMPEDNFSTCHTGTMVRM